MRDFRNLRCAFVCLLAIALLLVTLPPPIAAQDVTYTITDLGPLAGSESKAYGLNRTGRVVGESSTSGGAGFRNPVVWNNGVVGDIATFGGVAGSAFAVNDIGYAVGGADNSSTQTHAFIWSDIFGKKDLGTLGGSTSIATDINNANQVVGQSEFGGPGSLLNRGYVWDNTNGSVLIPTLGGSSNAARGINDSGHIVGYSDTASGEQHGFFLAAGVNHDIPTLGGTLSIANEVNNNGQVVGYSTLVSGTLNPPYHAFVWLPGTTPTDIGTLTGGTKSIAYDINDSGEIVGAAEIAPGVSRAFVWNATSGMRNLNDLAPGSGWTLQEARGINAKGQIVGFGLNPSGFTHGFLATLNIDEIPGGEPPPCFVQPSTPIIMPRATVVSSRRAPKKAINRVPSLRARLEEIRF